MKYETSMFFSIELFIMSLSYLILFAMENITINISNSIILSFLFKIIFIILFSPISYFIFILFYRELYFYDNYETTNENIKIKHDWVIIDLWLYFNKQMFLFVLNCEMIIKNQNINLIFFSCTLHIWVKSIKYDTCSFIKYWIKTNMTI